MLGRQPSADLNPGLKLQRPYRWSLVWALEFEGHSECFVALWVVLSLSFSMFSRRVY